MLVNQNIINKPALYFPGRQPGLTQESMYAALEMYYQSNGLYDYLESAYHISGLWTPAMKSLRTPAHRSVEFYASHLWPGNLPDALPIEAEMDGVPDAVQQVWEWGAWGQAKQRAARWFAMLGNMFLMVRVSSDRTKVYLQPVKPCYVTAFECDYRGYITSIRIDITTHADGEPITHTEYWDKRGYRIWEGDHKVSDKLSELGTPKTTGDSLAEFGIDFVPVVHAKFADAGDKLGNACFVHALDKIDEANRQATRLHELLFRYGKPTVVVSANDKGPQGQPLPAPRFEGANGATSNGPKQGVDTGDDDIKYMPGLSTFNSVIPAIAWADALAILQDMGREIRRDLPELLFYDLEERSDLSGRAIRGLLAGAIKRVTEARGQAEAALVRADSIALTIAQFLNLPGFEASVIGVYPDGFKHSFKVRDVVEISESERAEMLKNLTGAGLAVPIAMEIAGYSETLIEEAEEAGKDAAAASQASLAAAMLAAEKNFNAGNTQAQTPETPSNNMTNVTSNSD